MKIAFRTDGDESIGTGHLSRCRAIGIECLNKGHEICFFSRKKSIPWLIKYSIPFKELSDAADEKFETAEFIEKAMFWGTDFAIIDSYYLSENCYESINAAICSLAIDDYARISYRADILLNSNLYAQKLDYSSVSVNRFLLGGNYTILRDEFRHTASRPINECVERILITMGGSDVNNYTQFVLSALQNVYVNEILIIIGAYANCLNDISSLSDACKSPTRILQAPNNIAELFASSDIAISAAGSTVYELCALGVPTILIEQADNQRLIMEYFAHSGPFIPLGNHCDVTKRELYNAVNDLIEDSARRKAISKAAKALVDLNGVLNVVEVISNHLDE